MGTTAKWVSVSIGLPPEINNAAEKINDVLETVSTILEIVNAILEIIKIFVVDIANPLKLIIKALLAIIDQLIQDFLASGLYMYVDAPNNSMPIYAQNIRGGTAAWRNRMGYALLSSGVTNRPQFSNSASVISFHLVVDSGDIGELLSTYGFLLAMLGEAAAPKLNPPKNVAARPINEAFYNEWYDTSSGRLSSEKVKNAPKSPSDFLIGEAAIDLDPNKVQLAIRHDLYSGEELVIDKKTGAIRAVQPPPDAVLLTWKIDSKQVPTKYIIQRSTIRGGEVATSETTDVTGAVIGENEPVRDQEGELQRTYEEEFPYEVDFSFGDTLAQFSGRPSEQIGFLDNNNIEAGLTYYYRIVPQFNEPKKFIDPNTFNLSNNVVRGLVALLLAIQKGTSGRGIPSPIVAVYMPNDSDRRVLQKMAEQAVELEGGTKDGFTGFSLKADGGWSRVGIADSFGRPLLILLEKLKSFVEAFLALLQSGAEAIVAFIELIQTRINTLNTFIEILQAIIALLQAFELVSFGCLFTVTDNGIAGVLQAINDDSLEGTPSAGEDEYVASVTILGGTAGAGSALNALQLLFGLS